MIAVIDYGMGNLRSVQKGLEKTGHAAMVTCSPQAIRDAGALVLPGVGAFRDCIRSLETLNLIDPICSRSKAESHFWVFALVCRFFSPRVENSAPHPV